MSNLVTNAAEAWIKLQRRAGGWKGFHLGAAEYAFLDADITQVVESAAIETAGPAVRVEAILTGPFQWSLSDTITLDVSLDLPGATGTPDVDLSADDNTVTGVTITEGGEGYTAAPTVTFLASAQTAATGTAVIVDGAVDSITIDTAGSYLDTELPVTVTIAASNTVVVVDVNDGDQTPALILKLKDALRSILPGVSTSPGGTPTNATLISESALIMTVKNGGDITINAFDLA